MKSKEQFAVVRHTRWLETDEPKATVIRSNDGWHWYDVCTTDPDTAEEIAEALSSVEDDRINQKNFQVYPDEHSLSFGYGEDGVNIEFDNNRRPIKVVVNGIVFKVADHD